MFVHSRIFGISYIDYFTICDFMNLLDDQIQNMLLNDAFYIYVGVHYQPHMTYQNWAQCYMSFT